MQLVLCSLMGYFFGNINAAYIISKLRGFDIRERGSGNAGASNVTMVMGKKAGLATALFDIFKAVFASLLAAYLFPKLRFAKILCGSACIIGHIFPVLMNFHGGKGLACLAGMIISFDPQLFLLLLIFEMILGLSLDYICVVPITGSLIFTSIYALWTGDPAGTIILAVTSMIILYKHIENLHRIQDGTEAHISFLWKKDKEIERIKEHEH
ncbi:MAG: glycerol-3-phosphate acyltransferase [Ruminococcus sp.]|nr:glycerol-3-phosphate acyltransferase [Ruminococcus sp.]